MAVKAQIAITVVQNHQQTGAPQPIGKHHTATVDGVDLHLVLFDERCRHVVLRRERVGGGQLADAGETVELKVPARTGGDGVAFPAASVPFVLPLGSPEVGGPARALYLFAGYGLSDPAC